MGNKAQTFGVSVLMSLYHLRHLGYVLTLLCSAGMASFIPLGNILRSCSPASHCTSKISSPGATHRMLWCDIAVDFGCEALLVLRFDCFVLPVSCAASCTPQTHRAIAQITAPRTAERFARSALAVELICAIGAFVLGPLPHEEEQYSYKFMCVCVCVCRYVRTYVSMKRVAVRVATRVRAGFYGFFKGLGLPFESPCMM